MASRGGAPQEKGQSRPPTSGSAGPTETIEEMVGRMKLTAAESRKIRIDDREEGNGPSWALAGRILVPNPKVIHIQTISAVLRPAWGNPKGLVFTDGGPNLFIAELASEKDRDRIWEKSPWTVNKHAILLENYQNWRRPSELKFDRLLLWVRVVDLPRNMINTKWGTQIASDIGVEVVKIDTSNSFSGFLRARVFVDVKEPLRRWIFLDSTLREAEDWYELQYEQLPYFCFSCGLLGHSAVMCPTPAERDEFDALPYGPRLRVSDDYWRQGPSQAFGKGAPSAHREDGSQQHERRWEKGGAPSGPAPGRQQTGRVHNTAPRRGPVKPVYRRLDLAATETGAIDLMDTGTAMVLFEGNMGLKRDIRPEQLPNAEKASPDPKKKKVSPSNESATAAEQPRQEQ
ncbi:hypothetical protein QYE76_023881 [Lolium multiflorum]|uniref:CCHC-type domain-containing protein n=1 Tax=Lolium multiflorum TaxID=4521 RepID=A0AAD8VT75_LOLMU|nr:hypothetical protein QYE76_023881 [Lolium multiflorum]